MINYKLGETRVLHKENTMHDIQEATQVEDLGRIYKALEDR
jgi:hypothetical protein